MRFQRGKRIIALKTVLFREAISEVALSADDTASDMQLGDAGTVAGASEAVTVSVSAPPPSAAERARQVKFAARSALSKHCQALAPRRQRPVPAHTPTTATAP